MRLKRHEYTARQRKVIKLICADFSQKQVAEKMGLRFGSINRTMNGLHKKMRVHRLVQFVQYALHHRLVRNIYEK